MRVSRVLTSANSAATKKALARISIPTATTWRSGKPCIPVVRIASGGAFHQRLDRSSRLLRQSPLVRHSRLHVRRLWYTYVKLRAHEARNVAFCLPCRVPPSPLARARQATMPHERAAAKPALRRQSTQASPRPAWPSIQTDTSPTMCSRSVSRTRRYSFGMLRFAIACAGAGRSCGPVGEFQSAQCEKLVAQGIAADRAEIQNWRSSGTRPGRHGCGASASSGMATAATSTSFRSSPSGYAHGYTLTFEIVGVRDQPILLHSDGYYLDQIASEHFCATVRDSSAVSGVPTQLSLQGSGDRHAEHGKRRHGGILER